LVFAHEEEPGRPRLPGSSSLSTKECLEKKKKKNAANLFRVGMSSNRAKGGIAAENRSVLSAQSSGSKRTPSGGTPRVPVTLKYTLDRRKAQGSRRGFAVFAMRVVVM